MKTMLLLLCTLFLHKPSPPLLLIDITLKAPTKEIAHFDVADYWQQGFPVYASDVDEIIAATDKLLRQMETPAAGFRIDTVATQHSVFLLARDASGDNISVTLQTTIAETGTSFAFTLVSHEMDKRKAQRRLLKFADYLAK